MSEEVETMTTPASRGLVPRGSNLVVANPSSDALVPSRLASGRDTGPQLPAHLIPTAIEKAAIVLAAIGPELANGVLSGLKERDMERFTATIGRMGRIDQRVLDAVIVEFLELLTIGPELTGGAQAARDLLAGLVDEKEIDRILNGRGIANGTTVWDRLNDAPIKPLVTYLQANHPQTVAMIVTELRAEKAAAALEEMEQEFAKSIVLRLAQVPSLDAQVADVVEEAIDREFLSVLQGNMSQRRPADLIAGLMNNISSDVRDGFLSFLEAKDTVLAQDVQRTMFTFEDIRIRLHGRDVAGVLRGMDADILRAALQLGEVQSSPTVRFLLDNLPRRLSEQYVDEIASNDPVSVKEGEAAQIELTKLIQTMVREGTISLIDKD